MSVPPICIHVGVTPSALTVPAVIVVRVFQDMRLRLEVHVKVRNILVKIKILLLNR